MRCVLCKGRGYNSDGIYVTNCELCYSTGKILGLDYCLNRMSDEARKKLSEKKIKKLRKKYDKQLLNKFNRNSHWTVGQLKEYLNRENIPDNTIIIQERIEDIYFENYGWKKLSEFIPNKEHENIIDEFIYVYCCYYNKERNRLIFTPQY